MINKLAPPEKHLKMTQIKQFAEKDFWLNFNTLVIVGMVKSLKSKQVYWRR